MKLHHSHFLMIINYYFFQMDQGFELLKLNLEGYYTLFDKTIKIKENSVYRTSQSNIGLVYS